MEIGYKKSQCIENNIAQNGVKSTVLRKTKKNLKKMKKISGKTSKQISEETGISKSTIDKLFAGQTKEPFLTSTKAIVHSMGFTLDDLYDLSNSQSYTQVESKLISNYRLLNDSGKEKLLEYSEDLIGNAKYITPDFSDIKEKHA